MARAAVEVTADDGTRLAVRSTGSGPVVLLVHPSSGGLDSWNPIVPLLADSFELWTYARRGYAPSDGCARPKTFADDVLDLAAVLTAAGGSAHVVGASYGATVVLHAARAALPGMQSLTLFEPPLFAGGPALAEVLDRYRELVDGDELAAAARLFATEVARVPVAVLDSMGDPGVPDRHEVIGCLHDLEAMAAGSSDLQQWGRVRRPVVLMQGSATWSPVPETLNALADVLPSVRRIVLEGQSHFATHTAPALFADSLRRAFGPTLTS